MSGERSPPRLRRRACRCGSGSGGVPPITELARGGTLGAMIDDWIAELERDAPDIVGAWRGIEVGQLLTVRREVRRRGGAGSAERIVGQLEATMAALTAIVAELPEEA